MPIPQPNLRGLVDNQVGDVITRLVTAVNALESGIARFSTPVTPAAPAAPAPFTLTPQILRTIRDALQVGGATPLNVTKLLGIESFIDEDLIVTGDWTFQGTVEFDNTVTLSGFTATRILFVGAGGVISESANLTFDTSTGTVTIRGNNTGITTPFPLNVLRFLDTDTTTALNQPTGKIEFYSSDATVGPGVQSYIASISSAQQGPGILVFGTGSIGSVTERFRIDNSGNLGLGVTAWGTNAVRVYGIATGTAPTTSPADMIQMYVADAAAGDARLYILTESGTTPTVIGNGIISVGAGAVGTPAFTFGLDPDTGIYNSGTNELSIATAGAQRVTVNSSGMVSIIGNNSAGAALNILRFLDSDTTAGAGQEVGKIEFYTSDSSPGPAGVHSYIVGITKSASGVPTGEIAIGTGSTVSVTEKVRITNFGNVKIGGTADRVTTEGTSQLVLFNGTAPAGTLTNGCSIYSVAGTLTTMNSSGTGGAVYFAGGTDVAVADGGTGLSSWTTNGILYASGATTLANSSLLTFSSSILALTGRATINQSNTGGAAPTLSLIQADISEEFIRFQGSAAAAVLTQSIVAAADVATFTPAGYLKCFVIDDGNQITDQAYYVQIGTLA